MPPDDRELSNKLIHKSRGYPEQQEEKVNPYQGDGVDVADETLDDSEPSLSARPLAAGVSVIQCFLATLGDSPGVYRMLSGRGDVLYVGKAKNLKKRVVAYTRPERQPLRIQRMISETAGMEVVTTRTEVEALLLESTLIKSLGPRYNILLKDDKTFPHILITAGHDWPQVVKHRGARTRQGEYFGPFASAGAVNQTLAALQRAFLLRSCTDSVFSARTRPCLLYQIKRCSAPCADRISAEAYRELVEGARSFLSGQSQRIRHDLTARMEAASDALEFEEAAMYRDRLRALARVQASPESGAEGLENADVVALHQAGGSTSVQVFFFRAGCHCGNRAYFPSHGRDAEPAEIMAAFLGQFYADRPPPSEILLNLVPAEAAIVAEALSEKAKHKVTLLFPKRGDRKRLIDHVADNARDALARRMAESGAWRQLLEGVATALGLEAAPQRIEVYDNSHIQGSDAVGAMIVAGPEGLLKSAWRKFNIRSTTLTPGDDFGMMREVLTRRLGRAQKEDPDRDRGHWPGLILVDGGQGQLTSALAVLEELGIDDLAIVGIAKGPDRDAGRERFFIPGREPFMLPLRDPVLYFLQRLRDEAHRFAIGTHRARRSQGLVRSTLDEVTGIGARRKKALLTHFGSARAVAEAALSELEAVEGISRTMARKLHDHFHPEEREIRTE
ncbi:excinuclease ABC subunit C [Magnetospirillum molischianum DSM 120]|uniref:UvrABC system protein C n=1 Tax=Magnetospirillum molischianum DSM 120 TaxID=1150626 RepID=H8FT22_MAGML|nr:excinuclease ABC subunit C [Magnetospirillum molischianum DSM 120]